MSSPKSTYGNNQYFAIAPACAPDIERALLRNLILTGNSSIDQVHSQLRSADIFYKDENKILFTCIMKLYHSNQTVDYLTVQDEIKRFNIEIEYYITDLFTESTIGQSISDLTNADYILILQQKYVHRRALLLSYQFQEKLADSRNSDADFYYIVEDAYRQMSEIISGKGNIEAFSDVIQQSFIKLEERIAIRESGKLPGINTGLTQLNKMLAGWQAGDLVVIAARPGMGKTSLALHIAETAARFSNAVMFFSLEMSSYRLADRLIIGETALNGSDYRHGNINNIDKNLIIDKGGYLSQLKIFIDETPGVDIEYIAAQSRIAVRRNDVKIIIVDYLQLINMNEQRGQTRDQAIGIVTRKLKTIAKELQVPVILLSQLNRSVEARTSKEPTLADLRESGNIEQDADIVMFLYRPSYYALTEYREISTDHVLWLLTRKFRDGQASDIPVKHNDSLTKFRNYGIESEPF